jgi:hypothetical protein
VVLPFLTAAEVAARYGIGPAMDVQVQLTEAGARPLATQGPSDVLSPTERGMTIADAAGQHVANRLAVSQQGSAS